MTENNEVTTKRIKITQELIDDALEYRAMLLSDKSASLWADFAYEADPVWQAFNAAGIELEQGPFQYGCVICDEDGWKSGILNYRGEISDFIEDWWNGKVVSPFEFTMTSQPNYSGVAQGM